MARSPIIEFIIKNNYVLTMVDFWREIFMNPDRVKSVQRDNSGLFIIRTDCPLYRGKFFVYEKNFYFIEEFTRTDDRISGYKEYKVKAAITDIPYDESESEPLLSPQQEFTLRKSEIDNYTLDHDIVTTVGIYLANYVFLVYPFGSKIPYINDEFSTSKLEKLISVQLLDNTISTSEVKDKYINSLYLFGQSTDIFCPNISEKTISIPDSIIKLRQQLISENKEALLAGDASVMSDVEQKLISAYKDYIKDDPAKDFLLKKKYYDVTLKKLFLVQGMVEDFGSPGKFTFVDQPMGEGWKVKDLPTIFNEVRSGSYARGIETADGGVIAKLILRVLQDSRIDIPDCGTTRGELVVGTKDQLKDFLWNYIVEKDGANTLITEDLIPTIVGRPVTIRTPGYCQSKEGYCAKCFGKPFEALGQKAFAPVANDFAKAQQTRALKAMHGKSVYTVDVSDINKYIMT